MEPKSWLVVPRVTRISSSENTRFFQINLVSEYMYFKFYHNLS